MAHAATATTIRSCKFHPGRPGEFRCISCRTSFCPSCVKVHRAGGAQVCTLCGDMCEDVAALEASASSRRSFSELVPGAFFYPFEGAGAALFVMAFIFFGFVKVLQFTIWGRAFGILCAGYWTAWLMNVVSESAMGKKEIPNWPDITDLYHDVIGPLKNHMGVLLISFGPALAALIAGFMVHPAFAIVSVVLVIVGLVYYPMALLTTALGTRMALYPAEIIGSIARVPGPYALAWAIFALIAVLLVVAEVVLPSRGPISGPMAVHGVSLYLAIVEMRLLGLLYLSNADKLGWFTPGR